MGGWSLISIRLRRRVVYTRCFRILGIRLVGMRRGIRRCRIRGGSDVARSGGRKVRGKVKRAGGNAGVTEVQFRRGMGYGVWGGLKNDFALGAWLGRFVPWVTCGTGV